METVILNYTLDDPKTYEPIRNVIKTAPLTTKKAVEFFINGTLRSKVCKYCLNVTPELSELDQIYKVAGKGVVYDITIRDMITTVYPFQIRDDPNLPSMICTRCLNKTLSAYLFAQHCEQTDRAIRNCFTEIDEKLSKLDPLQDANVKKRGRRKNFINHNILHASHENVIDYAEPLIHLINRGSAFLNKKVDPQHTELECPKCWQVLPNTESLINHEKSHPSSMWFHCRLCGSSFAKLLHLKRHIKTCNRAVMDVTEKPKRFSCKDCGAENDTYILHLQHVEKHKFKKVLDHLVMKRLDDLCTVCLDKGSKMEKLQNTVALHGNCPELNGDKNLYNIVGATLPLHHSYKYQELMVPNMAVIVKTTQKWTNNEISMFNFNFPIKIDDVGKHFDKYDICNFYFAKPLHLSIDGNDRTVIEFNDENSKTSNDEKGRDSKVQTVDATNKTAESPTNYNAKEYVTCKTCWIFKKQNCQDCICKTNSDNNKNDHWIYDKVNENKDTHNVEERIAINTINLDINEVDNNDDTDNASFATKDLQLTVLNNYVRNKEENSYPTENVQKRKRNFENLSWLCGVCLTNNDKDRKACYCCESENNSESKKIKFNFGTIGKTARVYIGNYNEDNGKSIKIEDDNIEELIDTQTPELPAARVYIGNVNEDNHKSIKIGKSIDTQTPKLPENCTVQYQRVNMNNVGTPKIDSSNNNMDFETIEENMDTTNEEIMIHDNTSNCQLLSITEPIAVSNIKCEFVSSFTSNETFTFNMGRSEKRAKNHEKKVSRSTRRITK